MLSRTLVVLCPVLCLASLVQAVALPFVDHLSFPRTTSACGGVASLSQCGGSLPQEFCCPQSTTCLPLNVTGAVAIICCPLGSDCEAIQPTTCDETAYDANQKPNNAVHSDPIVGLSTCGSACCPMGYTCQNGMCWAMSASAAQNSTTSATATVSNGTLIPTSSSTPTATSLGSHTNASSLDSGSADSSTTASTSFSATSFVAGFLPGIFIGILALLAIFWCLTKRRKARLPYKERNFSRDQLTTLSPLDGPKRPKWHSRSISEPTVIPTSVCRTDFLRTSPSGEKTVDTASQAKDQEKPIRTRTPRLKNLFNFSPDPSLLRTPIPAHLKRGTLSYTISPIRQLRTKRSLHSLRRHATDASTSSRADSERQRLTMSRTGSTGSTETIQVLMPSMEPYTPDRHDVSSPPGQSTTLGSSRYDPSRRFPESSPPQNPPPDHDPSVQPYRGPPSSIYTSMPALDTPTRRPSIPQQPMLGTPYTPSRYYGNAALANGPARSVGPSSDDRRVTTFSGLMEKAGLRKEDFLAGPPPRR